MQLNMKRAKRMVRTAKRGANLLDKLSPSGNSENGDESSPEGVGDGRRMPIQQAIDVAVPVESAWKLWNKYEDYPKFMHRIESAEKLDPKHVQFTGKIWGISRDWEAKITEQSPDQRIAWTSTSGKHNAGVVTFHRIDDATTRVTLQMDWDPEGMKEKAGQMLGRDEAQVKSDLERFKEFIESRGVETGAWRGEVSRGTTS